jgi:hypothetical protein
MAWHKASPVEWFAIELPLYARSKPVGLCDDDCMTGAPSLEATNASLLYGRWSMKRQIWSEWSALRWRTSASAGDLATLCIPCPSIAPLLRACNRALALMSCPSTAMLSTARRSVCWRAHAARSTCALWCQLPILCKNVDAASWCRCRVLCVFLIVSLAIKFERPFVHPNKQCPITSTHYLHDAFI